MKLALGTVQFGMSYGAFNRAGKVPPGEVRAVLEVAHRAGISILDTAYAYGDSQSILGDCEAGTRFRLITKIPAVSGPDAPTRLRAIFQQSIERLRVDKVDALLLHAASDLLGGEAEAIWAALVDLRIRGYARQIGFSAYGPDEAREILERYPIDIVQLPLNVFDRRHVEAGILDFCHSRGIAVHARSVFLQGFCLADPKGLKGHLAQYEDVLTRYRSRCEMLGLSPLQAALRFALTFEQISQVVVGVESSNDLSEIINAASGSTLDSRALRGVTCDDLDLVDPSRWKVSRER